jgi:phosphohistidine phosphatase
MKTVMLLRHAKSSWDEEGVSDHERPLAPRGRGAAPRMGAAMARRDLLPDAVMCSDATRAIQTLGLALSQWPSPPAGDPAPIRFDRRIYEAEAADLVSLIQGLDAVFPDAQRVLLVGHNPTFEQTAGGLTGGGDPDAIARLTQKFPTAALAVLKTEATRWSDVAPGTAALIHFIRPEDGR